MFTWTFSRVITLTGFKDFREVYSNRVELHTKDLFLISRFAYMDKHDRLNRVENLFRDVPVRSWTDGR